MNLPGSYQQIWLFLLVICSRQHQMSLQDIGPYTLHHLTIKAIQFFFNYLAQETTLGKLIYSLTGLLRFKFLGCYCHKFRQICLSNLPHLMCCCFMTLLNIIYIFKRVSRIITFAHLRTISDPYLIRYLYFAPIMHHLIFFLIHQKCITGGKQFYVLPQRDQQEMPIHFAIYRKFILHRDSSFGAICPIVSYTQR